MTTSQTTPQTSPNGTPISSRIDRKKALELKLQRKMEALANMQERIFETQLEILELQGRKEGQVVKKKKDHHGSPQDTRMEVGEVVSDDTGSEWSDESLSCWRKHDFLLLLLQNSQHRTSSIQIILDQNTRNIIPLSFVVERIRCYGRWIRAVVALEQIFSQLRLRSMHSTSTSNCSLSMPCRSGLDAFCVGTTTSQ